MRINNTLKMIFTYKILKQKTGPSNKPLPHMTQYFLQDNQSNKISFWNDVSIELDGDKVTNVIQIPKQNHGKFQVIKTLEYHPFMQDTRKNLYTQDIQLRFYAQFPLFNYGYIPQTWEQDILQDQQGLYGDDDPVDICELSENVKMPGSIFQTTVLGSFCLIDQGQIDWKILTMQTQQADKRNIKDLSDINPEHLKSIQKWFKIVKIFDGKPKNTIAYNQRFFTKHQTIKVIKQLHDSWQKLKTSDNSQYVEKRNKYHIK